MAQKFTTPCSKIFIEVLYYFRSISGLLASDIESSFKNTLQLIHWILTRRFFWYGDKALPPSWVTNHSLLVPRNLVCYKAASYFSLFILLVESKYAWICSVFWLAWPDFPPHHFVISLSPKQHPELRQEEDINDRFSFRKQVAISSFHYNEQMISEWCQIEPKDHFVILCCCICMMSHS